jgi:hypothetical protein
MALYIPKQPGNSDIQPLTAEGNLRLSDGSLYYGKYHYSPSDNKPYTGIIDSADQQLLYSTELLTKYDYNMYFFTLDRKEFSKYASPIMYIPEPIDSDYKKTFIVRYFVQRVNSNLPIIEVKEDQYKTLEKPFSGLDENLYKGIQLDWKIYGPKNDIKSQTGMIIQYGISDTNKRTLEKKEMEMPGIRTVLPELLQFAKIVIL